MLTITLSVTVDATDHAAAAEAIINSIKTQVAGANVTIENRDASRILQDAHQVLRKDYWDDVRGVAEDLQQRLKDGDFTDIDDFVTAMHETLDGHQRVIYTFEAQQALLYSDNSGAYIEDFGTEGVVNNDDINWSALAYAAFERDVIEHLDAIGVDVNNPIPEPEEEDQP